MKEKSVWHDMTNTLEIRENKLQLIINNNIINIVSYILR